jgi:hypothetical protein
MSRITLGVNLDDVESGYKLIPAGTYLLKVKSTKPTKSKSSNRPVIRWSHVVIEPEEFAGSVIPDSTSLTDEALWRLKQLLEAVEVTWDEDSFDPDDAVDREFIGEVVTDEYEGKTQNKIVSYHKVGEHQPEIKEEEA